jgi:hypothetical protein
MTELEAARRRFDEAERELEAAPLGYLEVLAEARQAHMDARAERERALQNLQTAIARERARF